MPPPPRDDRLGAFAALACAATWTLAAPTAIAFSLHRPPPAWALPLAGLSAFGPTLAARFVGGRGSLGAWRADLRWMLLGLGLPLALHLATIALVRLAGGTEPWLHTPTTPEQFAALVVFPLGEEPGWRGFAHGRFVTRYGAVRGALACGALWGIWHLAYTATPAGFDLRVLAMNLALLIPYGVLVAWVFERSRRSLAVAVAMHAGAHVDNLGRVPLSNTLVHGTHLFVVTVAAVFAARALDHGARAEVAPPA